jgi:hypothetical protein
MTKSLAVVCCALLTLGLILNQPSFGQQASSSAQPAPSPAAAAAPPAPHGHGIGEATILIIHGKIASVDRAKRLVTLVGLEGNEVTFKVAKSANLASVKTGDPYVAHFFESVHVRRKRPGEALPTVSLKEGISTATPGQTPESAVHSKRKVVLTVVATDPKDGTVTVKDPDGAEETVKVDNSKYLRNVKAGDDLVVTVRQAVAISLDKDEAPIRR